MDDKRLKIVGVIPAAGKASRLSLIPCSKEIFPIGFQESSGGHSIKVAARCLLESFREAGTDQVYMITRKGKWDIPQYLGVGSQLDLNLAYIITEPTRGTHHTIDLAHSFVKDRITLLGFPDILFEPKNAFTSLLEKQRQTGAEAVLGLFKATNPHKADMVDTDDQGHLREIVIKPDETDLEYTWTIAVWTPIFSEYLHKFVVQEDGLNTLEYSQDEEIFIGDVIQNALEDGLKVETVLFPDGKYIDIGTIPDLKKVLNNEF